MLFDSNDNDVDINNGYGNLAMAVSLLHLCFRNQLTFSLSLSLPLLCAYRWWWYVYWWCCIMSLSYIFFLLSITLALLSLLCCSRLFVRILHLINGFAALNGISLQINDEERLNGTYAFFKSDLSFSLICINSGKFQCRYLVRWMLWESRTLTAGKVGVE